MKKNKDMEATPYSSDERGLLTLDEFCAYLGIGKTKARELLHDYRNNFAVRIGNRVYAHKKRLDEWLDEQADNFI